MRKLFVLFVVILVAGCATTPTPQELEMKRSIAATVPTCKEAKECEVKWAAARNWITANSGWKLQHVQPDFMETYNSVDGSTGIAVRVTKQPRQDGSYSIDAAVWCDNWIGCFPDKWVALKHFNDFVNASWQP